MAFRDQSGKIMIDEVAAQRDISNLRNLSESLNHLDGFIEQINLMALEFNNEINREMIEECITIRKKVSSISESTEFIIELINKTVDKYQQVDEQLKNLIAL